MSNLRPGTETVSLLVSGYNQEQHASDVGVKALPLTLRWRARWFPAWLAESLLPAPSLISQTLPND
jgi:hypothetical protein